MLKYVLCVTSLLALLPGPTATPAHGQEPDDRFTEQSIYIPYEKLQETFEKQGRGVFVPYEQFQKLWQAARAQRPKPDPLLPPVQAMITQIESVAQVETDVVRVNSRLKIDLLGKGWIRVPLRLPDSAILSAQLDGQPARIVSSDPAGHELLLKKDDQPATQVNLTLEYARSFTKAPGQNRVAFQPPMAPVNRWEVHIPEPGVKVNMYPMLAATQINRSTSPSNDANGANNANNDNNANGANGANDANANFTDDAENENGAPGTPQGAEKEIEEPTGATQPTSDPQPTTDETVYLAFVGAAPDVRIEWTPRSEGASGLQALVSVQTEQQVTIDEGALRTRARLVYEISRAELAELQIEVPRDQKVVNVVDANLRQWEVAESDKGQTIRLRLFEPARQSQEITIELEQFREDRPQSDLQVPVIRALDVGRQRGVVTVQVADSLRAEAIQRVGLLQLDTAEVPPPLARSQPQFAFRYTTLPFDLTLHVEQVQPRITVEQLVSARLEPQKLTLELFVLYDIQRSGVFDLLVDLPADFEVRSVQGHAQQDVQPLSIESHAVTGDGPRQLAINLSSKALGRVGLRVQLERLLEDANLLSPTGESSPFRFSLPRAIGEHIVQSHGAVVVYAPESLRLSAGDVVGLRNVAVDEALSAIDTSSTLPPAGLSPTLSFAFSEGDAQLDFTAQRRQPMITARQLLVARVDPGAVRYEATFRFEVKYSGVKALRLDVPSDIAASIRNETPQLRETALTPPPADVEPGYVAWQLTGDTELLGSQTLKLTWETPLSDLGIGKSVQLPVPRLSPRGVDRAEGQIVLIKAETIDLVPQGTPTGLDPIDPQRDLTDWPPVPDAAAALEFHDQWGDLVLNATRYQLEGMKQTSIESGVLRVVVTRSDRLAVQALYRMRSNQQRLQIQMPAEVTAGQIEFDTAPLRINGHPVTLERGADDRTFYVPLVGHSTEEPFLLELRYTSAGTSRRIGYPTFPDEPAVQEVNLIVYLPEEQAYLGHRGPWTSVPNRRGSWFTSPGRPQPDPNQLIAPLYDGVSITGNPVSEFPVDGEPFLFTTLRPDPPDTGALRVATFNNKWLQGSVFVGLALLGLALLARPLQDRLVVVLGVVALLLLSGVFLPSLTSHIVGGPLLIAAALVGLLWLAALVAQGVKKLPEWRPTFRRKHKEPDLPTADAGASKPEGGPDAATNAESQGGGDDA